MEKIVTQPKMSKLNLNCMFFEVIMTTKGNKYRVRSSSLAQIPNIKNVRPEATSTISYENAIQKLIPKLKDALTGTNKQLGNIFQDTNGKLMYSVEDVIYKNSSSPLEISTDSLNLFNSIFINCFKSFVACMDKSNIDINQLSSTFDNTTFSEIANISSSNTDLKPIRFQDVIVEWQQALLERTEKNYEDDEYFSATTLESYSRNLRAYVFPYLEEHPELDNIHTFSEKNIDDIFTNVNGQEAKRIILLCSKLIFEFAK